jgi:hypothetical protein
MSFEFKPAVRENVSLLIALAGASGSGKTYSALRLAKGLSPAGKIAFIDTEARRGLHYAERFDFMHADMRPPFHPSRFIDGVQAAEEAGAEVVIIDSFSHEYDGEGGIIEWADQLARGTPKKGVDRPRMPNQGADWWKDWEQKPMISPTNWIEPKMRHKQMVNAMLQSRASLIFCLRADEKIEIVKDDRGKTQIRPLGWMPICEKRFIYECTTSFTLTPDRPGKPNFNLPHKLQDQHRGFFSDDRCIDEEAGRLLGAWARGGATKPVTQAPTIGPTIDLLAAGQIEAERGLDAYRAFWKGLTAEDRQSLAQLHEEWKKVAQASDERFLAESAE